MPFNWEKPLNFHFQQINTCGIVWVETQFKSKGLQKKIASRTLL